MATIRSTVQMVDGMSPVIRSMTNALNICISSFEAMQAVSSNAIDTSSFEAARREVNNAEMAMNQMEASIMNSNNAQNQFNHSMQEGHNHASSLLDTIKGVAVGMLAAQVVMGSIQAIGNGLKASDTYVQTQARLNLMNDGLRTTEQLNEAIFQSAERSRSSYTETAKSVAKLGILAKNAFLNNDEMVAFAEQMNKQFKIGGASIEEQTAGMYQLTQAMASGKLQGDEFRSIMENAPLLAQAISQYTGKTQGELKEMSAKGQITADIIKKSMFAAADETNARFESLPKTIEDVGTKIKNNAMKVFAPILIRINDIVNYNFDSIINNVGVVMRVIANVGTGLINAGVAVGTFFQNNWGIIEPIILTIVAALVLYKGAMLAGAVATGISSLANSIYAVGAYNACASLAATELALTGKIAAETLNAMATASSTAAQWGFNAALLACPVTWIVIAILVIIAALYIWVAYMNKVHGTTTSATGIIAGTFMALAAVIYNIIAYVWNVFAAYAEFIANVFTNPTEAAKRLFINLALIIIDSMLSATRGCDQFATNMANAIISGINMAINAWNDFVDLLNSFGGIGDKLGLGKGSTLGYTASITSDLDSAKVNLEGYLANKPDNYITVPRMEAKDIGAAFNSGYKWGYDKSNMFAIPETPAAEEPNYEELLNNAVANTKDTADNTGKMKDNLEITDEDLKYLRDIAEQEVINRFTTAEIKVDMTNNNTINNNMDIDGIIHHLGDGIYENLQTVAEGATYDV